MNNLVLTSIWNLIMKKETNACKIFYQKQKYTHSLLTPHRCDVMSAWWLTLGAQIYRIPQIEYLITFYWYVSFPLISLISFLSLICSDYILTDDIFSLLDVRHLCWAFWMRKVENHHFCLVWDRWNIIISWTMKTGWFVKTEIYKHSWGIILVLIAFVRRIENHVLSPAFTFNSINILDDKHLQ